MNVIVFGAAGAIDSLTVNELLANGQPSPPTPAIPQDPARVGGTACA